VIKKILKFSRLKKKVLILLFDTILITCCIFLAFSLRLGYWYYPSGESYYLLLAIFTSPLLALPIFIRFGLYEDIIRFIGLKALWRIMGAVTFYAILWGIVFLILSFKDFPRSVIIINWLLVLISIICSRLFARWIFSELNPNDNSLKKDRVLIYGAGDAGRQLSVALLGSKEYEPVAFIDDDEEFYNTSINGLSVYSRANLMRLIEKKNIKEVLLAIPSLSRTHRSEIINHLEPFPVLVRTLPSISSLAQGKVRVDDLLEINLRDLLGRDLVKPNIQLLKTNISNKTVLVTGAGGSIGSELCRQVLRLEPTKLILYEISEPSLYQIEQELININMFDIEIFPVLGSITDKVRFKNICEYYGVQTVYHAAAYKHVPLVEFNQSQGVLNNSIGTMQAAKAAISANVETFVLISTDKAVRPTNVMGASKRVAELVLQALNDHQNITCFTMVRFGNVLDSSGSVIPLFKKQIRAGGPVTVTHAEVERYFMTIPEAVELVIQAGAMAQGGEVFVLDMGDPILIYDLAVKMIKLSGLQILDQHNSQGDIEILFTGLRPGEKLYEELLVTGSFTTSENKLIMRAEEGMIKWDKLEPILNEIKNAAKNSETKNIYKLLSQLVPEFKHQHVD